MIILFTSSNDGYGVGLKFIVYSTLHILVMFFAEFELDVKCVQCPNSLLSAVVRNLNTHTQLVKFTNFGWLFMNCTE